MLSSVRLGYQNLCGKLENYVGIQKRNNRKIRVFKMDSGHRSLKKMGIVTLPIVGTVIVDSGSQILI